MITGRCFTRTVASWRLGPSRLGRARVPFSTVSSVTPAVLRESADRMLDYYTAIQRPDGSLEGRLHHSTTTSEHYLLKLFVLAGFDDASHYCKLPNALVWGGARLSLDHQAALCRLWHHLISWATPIPLSPNPHHKTGRIREADAMLDHCVARFLRPNGTTAPSHPVTNC